MIPYAREAGALAGLALLVGVAWLAFDYGHGKGLAAGADELKALRAEYVAQSVLWARARTEASEKARELEQAEARRMAEAGEHYERGKRDAEEEGERTVADLRAGNLRLRQHWQGCAATSGLSAAAADAGRVAAEARLREEDAGHLVRLADQCDAWIGSLQRVAPR